MGTPEFALPTLQAVATQHEIVMVVTQPDRPAGRGNQLTPPPVKVKARALGLPIMQPTKVRTPEFAHEMRSLGADAAIVIAYGRILPLAVLQAFRFGCLNVHGSLLPAYRGAAPVQHAIWDGHTQTGVSIMQLDEGMDTGPVFRKCETTIGPSDTSADVLDRLAVLGADALVATLAELVKGNAVAVPQPAEGASHATMLRKEDGYISFAAPAPMVSAHMRAVDPWPGVTAILRGQRVKLFGVCAALGDGEPGHVLTIGPEGATIACQSGAVRVREIQPAGGKRLSMQVFANGRGVAVGDVLGKAT